METGAVVKVGEGGERLPLLPDSWGLGLKEWANTQKLEWDPRMERPHCVTTRGVGYV